MSGDLRAGPGAGRLQHTLAMRMLRVVSASLLSLVALLLWRAVEPLPRAHDPGESTTVSSAFSLHPRPVVAEPGLTNRKSAQSGRAAGRNQAFVRSRATDGDGDSTPSSALALSPATLFGDVAQSARVHLRRFALGHAPYGAPSPFDATAPPASSPRNG
jgi:hypothetical protein